MKLSIIIVNYNVKYFLEQCLCSVRAAIAGMEAEVLVVDNHSADGSVEYLRPRFPEVTFIENKDNPGFAKANNQAIRIIQEKGVQFDILDINMGCPAPKITSSGAGSKLMQDPELCGRMVAAARGALGPDKPLTVKMRIGWDAEQLTGVAVARQCEANGADLIAVHGRTREQMYIPPIDVDAITEIRKAVSIPVLANGDITTAEDAKQILEKTGCAGVMIGRGALGDPWLFERINAVLTGQPEPGEPSLNARMSALRAQIYEMCEEKGEWTAMPQARGQAMHYMKGLKGAASLRRYCSMLEHFTDVDKLIEAVYKLQG